MTRAASTAKCSEHLHRPLRRILIETNHWPESSYNTRFHHFPEAPPPLLSPQTYTFPLLSPQTMQWTAFCSKSFPTSKPAARNRQRPHNPSPNLKRNPFSPANPRYPNPHNTNKPRCPLRKTCFRHFRKHRPLLTPITRKKRLSPHQNPPSKPAARNRQRQHNPSRTRSETLSHRQTRHNPNPMKTEAAASP